jgi:uncharacterized membrane protein
VWLLILLTIAPFFELRAGIPYGIFKTDLPLFLVVVIAMVANILLAPVLFFFVNYVVHLFLRFPRFRDVWQHVVVRAQKRIKPYVDKYGTIGLAFFIGVPLPGSGVYTGALGAYALGFTFKQYTIASVVGVIIAGTTVTLITLFGQGVWLRLIT